MPARIVHKAAVIAALSALVATGPVHGQHAMDSLLVRPVVRCDEVGVNARALFAGYVGRGDLDSAALVLDRWSGLCPGSEPWQRSRILLLLARPALVDTALPENFLTYLATYRYLANLPKEAVAAEAPELAQNLAFSSAWSTQVMPGFSPGMVEHALAEFYGPDPNKLLPALQAGRYAGSRLQRDYDQEVRSILALYEVNFAVFAGAWVPLGNLAVLGPHPELGFQLGFKKARMNYDLTLGFRTGSANRTYLARRIHAADTLEPTSHFFGGHVSLDFGYDLLQHAQHEVQAVGGLGYDGFDAFPSVREDPGQSASAGSLDLSMGAGYRFYLKPYTYLGFQLKYHWTDHSANHVVDFRGHPFTFRILFGGLGNLAKRAKLEWVQYRIRQ
ncbi:MAG: hypothetical protein KBH07_09165 [Flavobacteriales bacterium]|nr:hypothetical protein [Flavobacteriales bacterium]MBP9080628.1 hypothetical protein [Flavobacteriales bacterium]